MPLIQEIGLALILAFPALIMFGSFQEGLEGMSDKKQFWSYFVFFFIFALVCIISTNQTTEIAPEDLPFINP